MTKCASSIVRTYTLFILFCFRSLFVSFLILVVEIEFLDLADGVLGHSDLDSVGSGLDEDGVLLDAYYASDDTSYGHDSVSDFKAVAELVLGFFLFSLRDDYCQIHDCEHEQQKDDRTVGLKE